MQELEQVWEWSNSSGQLKRGKEKEWNNHLCQMSGRDTIIQHSAPSAAPRFLAFNVPAPPAGFVEREAEREQLMAQVCNPAASTVAITTALQGSGGYGKTMLARRVAHHRRTRQAYPDAVLEVTVGEKPADLVALVRGVMTHFIPEHKIPYLPNDD